MSRLKVIVCDDDVMILQIVVSKLLSEGYDAASVKSGNDLLMRLRTNPADLIIIDAMMPGLDGGTAVETLKSSDRFRSIPVIMLSAKRDAEFVARMIRAGIADYIAKPFALGDLAFRVRKVIGEQREQAIVLD